MVGSASIFREGRDGTFEPVGVVGVGRIPALPDVDIAILRKRQRRICGAHEQGGRQGDGEGHRDGEMNLDRRMPWLEECGRLFETCDLNELECLGLSGCSVDWLEWELVTQLLDRCSSSKGGTESVNILSTIIQPSRNPTIPL